MAKENETHSHLPTTYMYALISNNGGILCVGRHFSISLCSFIIFVLTKVLVRTF